MLFDIQEYLKFIISECGVVYKVIMIHPADSLFAWIMSQLRLVWCLSTLKFSLSLSLSHSCFYCK